MASNIINQSMDYTLIYKPFTVLEAITLTIKFNVISVGSSARRYRSQISFPMGTKTIGNY